MSSTDQQRREREIISDLIDLYRDLPCLWDTTSETYKDARQKKTAWQILLQKYKELDQNANEANVKKKIDTLKFGYYREAKKVRISKSRPGLTAIDIHRPILWYYRMMTFLDTKNKTDTPEVDPLMIEDEDEDEPLIIKTKRKKLRSKSNVELKKDKLIDSPQEYIRTETKESNPFGVYVGKKMEEISSGQQRDLAEKLISEVIFLAKTNNLTFDTKVEIPSRTSHGSSHSAYHKPYFVHSTPTTQISQSPDISLSPPSSHAHHDSRSSLTTVNRVKSPPSSHDIENSVSDDECPAGEILKEMLISRK